MLKTIKKTNLIKFPFKKIKLSLFVTKFKDVSESLNFPQNEEEILDYWDKIEAFKTQLKKTSHLPKYTFYDGPPFATGLPHYGHIAAGTIKDVVTRYWSQNGRFVERRFGWDCHGLPIETQINKQLNIKTLSDLEKVGIEKYNNECRSIVMKYASEWRHYVRRSGRWIDFDNDYKTMDLKFMESVWWVFKQLFQKGFIYRKCKVMPYSTACNTVLSNFEAGMNYKDVKDPSILVTFPINDTPNRSFLVWTTTPWTLHSNLALAVNAEYTYLVVRFEGIDHEYIVLEDRINDVLGKLNIKKYSVLNSFKGSQLEGINYKPLFEDFIDYKEKKGAFKVFCAKFVTNEDGTGIVHIAPAFGESDFELGIEKGLIDIDRPLCPIDENGFFTREVKMVQNIHFKEADKIIIDTLKSMGRLIYNGIITHKYPLCYRTDTPLMYRAIPSWFVKVETIREDLLKNNKKSVWVPTYVQDKRFHNWLADAKDWCISRNRSWGNPIPLWVDENYEEIVCVGSIQELQNLTNASNITDLHREFIDNLSITSKSGKKLRRINEVFDCWFESGSMPYAQIHFPFSVNEEEFKQRFPADFIAEGLDQTRGWFYTLNVISTALYNETPYKNLIVNGLVLANTGEKLSKKLKNYDDPIVVFKKYGADAMRFYLINSPLVRGQSLRFKNEGVESVVKDVFLPLYNSYRFLIQNIQRLENEKNIDFNFGTNFLKENYKDLNIMDKWIIAYLHRLIAKIKNEMENYRLYTVAIELTQFMEKLSNWYIRLNRNRIKGEMGIEESNISLNILFNSILDLSILLSPIIPFLTEEIFLNLRKVSTLDRNIERIFNQESVHFVQIPKHDQSLQNQSIEEIMNNFISTIELGRKIREIKKIPLKMPIKKIQIISFDTNFLENLQSVESYIMDELNINEIEYLNDEEKYINLKCKPNFEELFKKSRELEDNEDVKEKQKLNEESQSLIKLINSLKTNEIRRIIKDKQIKIGDKEITLEQVIIEKKFREEFNKEKDFASICNNDCGLRIDLSVNEEINNKYYIRELINKIQKLRKISGLKVNDKVNINLSLRTNSQNEKLINDFKDDIQKSLKVPLYITDIEDKTKKVQVDVFEENHEILNEKIKIIIEKFR